MNDLLDYKKDLLTKEYALLIPMLVENKKSELQVRGWCFTLLVLIFGSSIKLEINNIVSLLLSESTVLLFFLLSLSQSYFITKSVDRGLLIQQHLNQLYFYTDQQIKELCTPELLTDSISTSAAAKKTFRGLRYKNMVGFYISIFLFSFVIYLYIVPFFI